MLRDLKVGVLLGLMGLLSACSPVTLPKINTYSIVGAPFTPVRIANSSTQTILITLPTASPGFDTTEMVYMTVPYKLRAYASNRWIASPSEMLMPAFAQALSNTGRFKAVLTVPFSGLTNYRLDTRLLEFDQDFIQPVSRFRLVLQATLMNANTNTVIANTRFQVIEPAPENNPYAGVLAANRALCALNRQLVLFVNSKI